MNLFFQPDFLETNSLSNEEAYHAVKVLRLRAGEKVKVTDGKGSFFEGIIETADSKLCNITQIEQQTIEARPYRIEIALAPTKNLDRIEWLVEKAIEIGIDRISFFYTQRSERRVMKLDRIQKIAVAAMKQSLQPYLAIIEDVGDYKKYVPNVNTNQKLIAHLPENHTAKKLIEVASPNDSYTVFIGPEGDFTNEELKLALDNGFEIVTLGQTRLRTETAALVACHTLHLLNEKHRSEVLNKALKT